MTFNKKLYQSIFLMFALILCLYSVSVVFATENNAGDGMAAIDTSVITTYSLSDIEISPAGADAAYNFDTLEDVGKYIRKQLAARNTNFTVSLSMSFDDYISGQWGEYGNKYFIDEALKHTSTSNEGDYIAYSFKKYSVTRNMEYNPNTGNATLIHQYTFTYYNSASEESYVSSRIPEILAEAGVESSMTNFEKSKLIARWIIDNVTYNVTDEDSTYKYSAYGAVYNGRAVCQGYSLLAYRLFMEAGIDCRMITGTVNGSNHAWILAKMDDGWYYNMDIMYEDTFESINSSKPYKYLYRGSDGFGDFFNHVYARGNTTDFNCCLYDYDTAEFDESYPTNTVDYAVAFAGSDTGLQPPVAVPENYYLNVQLRTALSKNGDIVFNISPNSGSGAVDSDILYEGEQHARYQYLVSNITYTDADGNTRHIVNSDLYQYQDSNTISVLLPFGVQYRATVSIKDYGVTPIQTASSTYLFTIPDNPQADSLTTKINTIVALCSDADTDYEKALILHDWIVDNAHIDNTNSVFDANGVLIRGTGTVQSYVRAYEMLLHACDIDAYRVAVGDYHDIVVAYLDGAWTFIDVMSDDLQSSYGDFEQHVYFGLPIDVVLSIYDECHVLTEDSTLETAILNSAVGMSNNYVLKSDIIENIAMGYVAEINPNSYKESTSFSIDLQEHQNNDCYYLYYDYVLEYIDSLLFRNSVDVSFNPADWCLDVTITKIDHSSHNLSYGKLKDALCEEVGHTAEIYCDTCMVVVEESQEIAATGHNWDYYHKCKNCGKFDTTPGNLIYYGAKDDPVRAEYKIVDNNSVQYYKCKAVDSMTDVKVADYIKIGGKVYYVTSMNPNCFADKTGLTSVHVGENITSIGAGVFANQTELVKVTGFNKVKDIYSKAFYNCTNLRQVGDIENVVNLPLVLEIRPETFYKCRNITTVYGMNKVFSIGDKAFYGCNKLTQIGKTEKCLILPTISKIGKESFAYCTGIKTLYSYSTQLKTINSGAFNGCCNLYSIKIASDKLETIQKNAFKGIASKAIFQIHSYNIAIYEELFTEEIGFISTMTLKGY